VTDFSAKINNNKLIYDFFIPKYVTDFSAKINNNKLIYDFFIPCHISAAKAFQPLWTQ